MWFAFALFAVLLGIDFTRGRRWSAIGRANTAKLVGIGAVTCITSIFYTYAMSVLPVPLALTLLFQFTWIGTVIQVAITRRPPAASQVVSALIIVFGTVFASGLYAADLSSCNPWGIAAGLVAAVSCAAFHGGALSGHKTECSQAQRGFLICGGAVVMSHLICPDFIMSRRAGAGHRAVGPDRGRVRLLPARAVVQHQDAASAHGLSTVLAASELPAGLFVAMLVLGSPIGPVEWAGVGIILAGVCVSQLQFLPKRESRTELPVAADGRASRKTAHGGFNSATQETLHSRLRFPRSQPRHL